MSESFRTCIHIRDIKITKSEIIPESEVPKDIVNRSKEVN